jgi:hypothetical protein
VLRRIRYLLRLTRGSGRPRDLILRHEQPHPIFAIGSEGGWEVHAPDVAPAHVLVAYNGVDLYVASHPSTEGDLAPRLDGARLATRWIPVRHTAHLELGQACIAILPRPAVVRAPAASTVREGARSPVRAAREGTTVTGDALVIEHLRAEASRRATEA